MARKTERFGGELERDGNKMERQSCKLERDGTHAGTALWTEMDCDSWSAG
ncbi:MAG: hypothetical protein HQL56_10220 [Magnetococcales bacterium]|nr:hypothetical protein [Magnetococcales bacterium]